MSEVTGPVHPRRVMSFDMFAEVPCLADARVTSMTPVDEFAGWTVMFARDLTADEQTTALALMASTSAEDMADRAQITAALEVVAAQPSTPERNLLLLLARRALND